MPGAAAMLLVAAGTGPALDTWVIFESSCGGCRGTASGMAVAVLGLRSVAILKFIQPAQRLQLVESVFEECLAGENACGVDRGQHTHPRQSLEQACCHLLWRELGFSNGSRRLQLVESVFAECLAGETRVLFR